jgi:hypothetical protein
VEGFFTVTAGFREGKKWRTRETRGMGQREALLMIHEMAFDPTDLRSLGNSFDESWHSILAKHPAAARPELRFRLASLVLHLARDRQLDQHQIKATALRLLTDDNPVLVATA